MGVVKITIPIPLYHVGKENPLRLSTDAWRTTRQFWYFTTATEDHGQNRVLHRADFSEGTGPLMSHFNRYPVTRVGASNANAWVDSCIYARL